MLKKESQHRFDITTGTRHLLASHKALRKCNERLWLFWPLYYSVSTGDHTITRSQLTSSDRKFFSRQQLIIDFSTNEESHRPGQIPPRNTPQCKIRMLNIADFCFGGYHCTLRAAWSEISFANIPSAFVREQKTTRTVAKVTLLIKMKTVTSGKTFRPMRIVSKGWAIVEDADSKTWHVRDHEHERPSGAHDSNITSKPKRHFRCITGLINSHIDPCAATFSLFV